MPLNLKIKLLRDVKAPSKGSVDAASLDLHTPFNVKVFSNMPPIEVDEDGNPKDVLPDNMLPLGISSEFSPEYVGLIFPRSGLGSNQGLHPRNIVGVIDADYRGEWKAALRVDSAQNTAIYMKDKAVLQVMFVPVADVNEYILVNQEGDEANHSAAENAVVRGDGGFGSTDA